MGFITHALGNALDPGPGNLQRATDASNMAYSHNKQAQQQALAALQSFITSNPNPAQGFGGIQGPNQHNPASVGGLSNPIGQSPGMPGQTPGIAPGPGAGPSPQAGGIPPQLLEMLKSAVQQNGQGGAQAPGGPPVQSGFGPAPQPRPLPPIQLPHPGPIIRMGPQPQ